MAEIQAATAHDEAPRVIGPLGAFSVVAGSMIGVGIFIYADDIAAGMGSVPLFFAMLLLGGFFALSGAVACGELGAMMPRAGGDYAFQRAAYGPSIAFASGWVLFAAIFAGSNAALAIAVCQYEIGPLLGYSIPEMLAPVAGPFNAAQLGGIGILVIFTVINDIGTSLSSRAQTVLTMLPIALMVGLGGYALIFQPEVVNPPTGDELAKLPETLSLAGIASAFLFVNFIFSGWINIIYVAAEVKDPGRNIPRSMISATGAVTLLYVLLGATFLAVLGLAGTASGGSPVLGFDAGTRVANALGASWLAPVVLFVISLAIITSINATVMAGARVGYAMARDGAFWAPVGKLSGARQTPRRALWFGTLIAVAIILTGTADAIAEMTSLAMFVTGSLTVAAMYVLRRKHPDAHRPYRASSVLPAIYILLAVFAIGAKLANAVEKQGLEAWYPLIGLGILAVTWVGHLAYHRHWKRAAAVSLGFILGGVAFHGATSPSQPARAATPSLEQTHASPSPKTAIPDVHAP